MKYLAYLITVFVNTFHSKSKLFLLICLLFSSLIAASESQTTAHVSSIGLALGSPASF